MRIERTAIFSGTDVVEALQQLFPEVCGGERHRLYRLSDTGHSVGNELSKAGCVVLKWTEDKKPGGKS